MHLELDARRMSRQSPNWSRRDVEMGEAFLLFLFTQLYTLYFLFSHPSKSNKCVC